MATPPPIIPPIPNQDLEQNTPKAANDTNLSKGNKPSIAWLIAGIGFFMVFAVLILATIILLKQQRADDENAVVLVSYDKMSSFEKLEHDGYSFVGLIQPYDWHSSFYSISRTSFYLFKKNDGNENQYAVVHYSNGLNTDKYSMNDITYLVPCSEGRYDVQDRNYKRFNYKTSWYFFELP